MWLILSIITAILWGISIATLKRSYQTLTPVMWIIYGAIAAVFIILPYALLNEPRLVLWPLVPISIIISGCYAFYAYAFKIGKIPLVATVQSTYSLFTVILAAIFLHEITSVFVKLGVMVIIIGLIMLSIENPKELKSIKIGRWLLWGLLASILAGTGDFLSKVMVTKYDPYTYMVGFVLGEIVIAFLAGILDKKNLKPITLTKDTFYMIISTVTLYLGYLFFFVAFNTGLASLVTPITGLYGVVTFALAIFWLKEKVTNYQIVGAMLTIFGAVVVSSM